jgi:hypothetical protein
MSLTDATPEQVRQWSSGEGGRRYMEAVQHRLDEKGRLERRVHELREVLAKIVDNTADPFIRFLAQSELEKKE